MSPSSPFNFLRSLNPHPSISSPFASLLNRVPPAPFLQQTRRRRLHFPLSLSFPFSSPPLLRFNTMHGRHTLLLILSSFLLSCASASASASASLVGGTAYEVLRSHGLPIGLLPKGVTHFRLDPDGRFEARLDSAPCTAKFEGDVRYNSTVTGTISPGQIAGISGVSAQDLFLWFLVRAIRLDDQSAGIIHFDVGVVDKRLPLALFETPPDCVPVSSSSPDDYHLLFEDSRIGAIVSESQSAALRYELDTQEAAI